MRRENRCEGESAVYTLSVWSCAHTLYPSPCIELPPTECLFLYCNVLGRRAVGPGEFFSERFEIADNSKTSILKTNCFFENIMF